MSQELPFPQSCFPPRSERYSHLLQCHKDGWNHTGYTVRCVPACGLHRNDTKHPHGLKTHEPQYLSSVPRYVPERVDFMKSSLGVVGRGGIQASFDHIVHASLQVQRMAHPA